MKQKKSLSAVGLQRIFIVSIVLMVALLIFGFSWLSSMLENQHIRADHTTIDAELARDDVTQLQQLETYIEDNQATINRAQAIVTEASQYQRQVVTDIESFARDTGVQIQGFNFVSEDEATAAAVNGTTVTNVTVTLQNPIEYTSYLRFLKAIEQNLTRMQVTGVSLTPNADNLNQVSNPQIGLEVYLMEDR